MPSRTRARPARTSSATAAAAVTESDLPVVPSPPEAVQGELLPVPDGKAPVRKTSARKAPARKRTRAAVPAPTDLVAEPVMAEAVTGLADEPAVAPPARKRSPRKTRAPKASAEAVSLLDHTTPPVTEAEPAELPATAESVEAAEAAAVPEASETPPSPSLPVWSELRLQAGPQGSALQWLPGGGCPAALQALAGSLQGEDGALDLAQDQGLLALHRQAAVLGHELRIEPAVWPALARVRDMRHRLHRLEQAYPEGEASPALRADLQRPGGGAMARFQLEGALFAACAGRSLLADEAGLGHVEQALGAAQLLARHFGVQRVLVLCAEAARLAWQRALPIGHGDQATAPTAGPALQHWLCDAAAWPVARALLRDWSPELVIVDDTTPWPGDDLAQDLSQWPVPYALWLSQADPAAQPERVASVLQWLDPQGHETRRPVLRRTRAQCLQPLAGRDDALLWVPPAPAQREQQAAALAVLQPVLRRWQRTGYVADLDQLALRAALQALHEACAATGAAKLQALQQQLPQWLAEAQAQVLLLTGSAAQREALAAALTAAGIDPQRWVIEADGDPRAAEPAHGAWHRVVSLDLPWRTAVLRRRVARAGPAPLQHLLADGGLDAWRLWAQAAQAAGAPALYDDRVVFLQDQALADWMQALVDMMAAAPDQG